MLKFREDKPRIILTADKVVTMVMMDKQGYPYKVQDLLADKGTDRSIPGDPTTKHKNELTHIFRTINVQGGLSDITYKKL